MITPTGLQSTGEVAVVRCHTQATIVQHKSTLVDISVSYVHSSVLLSLASGAPSLHSQSISIEVFTEVSLWSLAEW